MSESTRSEWTRKRTAHAVLLVVFLLVPLALAWGRTGPPADRAFHFVMGYFIELAIWVAIEVGMARDLTG